MNTEKQIDDLHEDLASTESELRDAREALSRATHIIQRVAHQVLTERQLLPSLVSDVRGFLARAALATQPAAGEPKPIGYISEAVHQELLNGKHVPANICTATPSRRNPHPGPDANWSVPIFAAPPAAAHGDEAVRMDAERYRWLRDYWIGDDPASINMDSANRRGLNAAIDAAMRAQAGEGGEV